MSFSHRLPIATAREIFRTGAFGLRATLVTAAVFGLLFGIGAPTGDVEWVVTAPTVGTNSPHSDAVAMQDTNESIDTDRELSTGSGNESPSPTGPDSIVFDGDGADVTDRFELIGGMVVTEWVHDGDSNFIVELVAPDGGTPDQLLANEIGETAGIWGQGMPASEYVLDIDADGDWQIEVIQPRLAEGAGDDIPHSIAGGSEGDWLAINLNGPVRVTASHDGAGNFIVESYTLDGEYHFDSIVFNEIGEFEGETAVNYDGTSWIVVTADGDWSLEFDEI